MRGLRLRSSRGPLGSTNGLSVGVAVGVTPTTEPDVWNADAILEDSYAWCKGVTRRSRSNFYYSFFTLPRELFRDMCVLYAFMRVTDDLGDDGRVATAERAAALGQWRTQIAAAFEQGRFEHPVLPALTDVVVRHAIPREHLLAVIDGVSMDLDPQGFETFDELSKYCYRVAGAVGLCCIRVWGLSEPKAVPLAVDCGLAFQLTNILRDLAEDARMGRCYLPREDLRRFEVTIEDLRGGASDARFRKLMTFEVARAREYFQRARQLLALSTPAGKPILATMLSTYGSLLNEIERRGFDVHSRPVRLGRFRKIQIAFWSLVRYRWLAR